MPLSHAHPPVRRAAALSRQVEKAISNSIGSGGLRPGERIVVEHVAQQHGVSQTPVREALGRLIQQGLIMEQGNGRFQVTYLTPAYVYQTFLVRGALEGLAAELASTRFSDAHLLQLVRAIDEVDESLGQGDFDAYCRFDETLHRAVCDVAKNEVLSREMAPLHVHIDFIRLYSRRFAGEHIMLSHGEHRTIVEALQAREPGSSRQAMETHIRKASQRIEQLTNFSSRDAYVAVGDSERIGEAK